MVNTDVTGQRPRYEGEQATWYDINAWNIFLLKLQSIPFLCIFPLLNSYKYKCTILGPRKDDDALRWGATDAMLRAIWESLVIFPFKLRNAHQLSPLKELHSWMDPPSLWGCLVMAIWQYFCTNFCTILLNCAIDAPCRTGRESGLSRSMTSWKSLDPMETEAEMGCNTICTRNTSFLI